MAGEIVLGYDGSEGAKAALPHAIDLAKALGVPLVVAFAYGTNPVGGGAGDLERSIAVIGQTAVAEAKAASDAAGVECETVLVAAQPVDGLVVLATEREARMLVIGGNGRGPMIGSLLGSVGYKLLHHTTVPVLVVQPVG